MFKNYFIAYFLVSATTSFAQITINSSDMPNAGDAIRVSVTNSTAGVNQTLTGPNFTWNFSALTPNNQRVDSYDSPLTFTSPYNLLFNPFNTTYGINNYQDTGTIAPGFSVDAAYDFFKESSVNFRQIGKAYTINGTPIPFIYQKPDTIYEFPMHYMNSDSCDYKYGLNIPSFGYYGQKGHRKNIVDGWGSLTTPFGTFAVLRVKSTITAVDTVYSTTFGFGTNIPRPLRNEYKWLATGKKIPVLYVDESAGLVTNVVYLDSLRAGISDLGVTTDFSVYPNPASSSVTIQFDLATKSKIKISILNIIGQTENIVANENFGEGKQVVTVNLNELNLAPGIYFINLASNGGRSVKKIVVTK